MARNVPQFTRGDRLRKARECAGITSHEMADRIGVSRQTVTRWEHGRHMPKAAVVLWATITEVPVDWLEDDGDDPPLRCYFPVRPGSAKRPASRPSASASTWTSSGRQ